MYILKYKLYVTNKIIFQYSGSGYITIEELLLFMDVGYPKKVSKLHCVPSFYINKPFIRMTCLRECSIVPDITVIRKTVVHKS